MGPVERGDLRPGQVRVEVVFSPQPRIVHRVQLVLDAGASVRDAVQACGLVGHVEGLTLDALSEGRLHVGVWGRRVLAGHVLRDLDRVEVYRGLKVDPKEARRVRYRAQGEKLPKGIHRPKAGPQRP